MNADTRLKAPEKTKEPKASQRRPNRSNVNIKSISAGNSVLEPMANDTKTLFPKFKI